MAFRPFRPTRLLPVVSIALFLAACGAREHYVTKAPSRPLSSFPAVEIKPFAVSSHVNDALDEKRKSDLGELTAMIAPRVGDYLSAQEIAVSTETAGRLIVEGSIVKYIPGNQALRYLVGFGAGSSRMVAEVSFKDAEGNEIGSGEFVGGVLAGGLGGNKADAVGRIAGEIADYIRRDAPTE